MSFQIWKKPERTPTPATRRSPSVTRVAGLSPELLAVAGRRLTLLALLSAGGTIVFAVIDRTTYMRGSFQTSNAAVWLSAVLASIALSLAVAWIATRGMFAPEAILDLGLVYEVVQALCLGIIFHCVPLAPGVLPRGWTAVAVWILVFPLIVPNTRGKTVFATVTAAAMDPVGLGINVLAGNPPLPARALLVQFVPTLVAAAVALVISRIVYELNVEAVRGQEMGSYHLEELLGRGGMGEVWRASHRLLAREAAVKLIRPDSPGSDGRESIKRFEREAKATAALHSPHTVNVYDFGTTEDGTFYYVMELLEGFDCDTLVSEFGALPPERAIHILTQAAHSLGEAHQGGLIHRDVKPANIYLCRYGLDFDFVKVLDFGLVKSTGWTDPRERRLTVAGMLAGTPGYMSPEMGLGNSDVDWRSDIYALGCVGYWLLTAEPVFDGATPMQIVMNHVQKTPVPPSRRARMPIPDALDQIILSCLEKDPNNRPQTMQELAASLRQVPMKDSWTEERARRWWLEYGGHVKRPPAAKPESAPPIFVGAAAASEEQA